MDDIDDLLDEVESKFCVDDSTKSNKRYSKPHSKISSTKSSHQDSLDDIINDIISDDGLDVVLQKNSSKSSAETSNPVSNSKSKLKCSKVYVAGYGSFTSKQQSICNQLHCTSCDNKIVIFDDYKWSDSDCDYLVFRNNYPDFDRLKSKLVPRKGHRAYCCQCCWLSVKDIIELKSFKPDFKWICRKH